MLRKQESALTCVPPRKMFIIAVSLSGLHPLFAQRLLRRSLAHFQIPWLLAESSWLPCQPLFPSLEFCWVQISTLRLLL